MFPKISILRIFSMLTLLALILALMLAQVTIAFAARGDTTRLSVDSSDVQANNTSFNPSISGNGQVVAFFSFASNLVSNDTNVQNDIFVRDTATNITTRVSVSSSEEEANQGSSGPAISADGLYVAFHSYANNLVSGDTGSFSDIFVRDMTAGTTARISIDSGGGQANEGSFNPAISSDGRYVAFYSFASDLVVGDTNGKADIFKRDTVAGTTERISVSSDETQGSNTSHAPSISSDGRYVAFYSFASDLVVGDTNGKADVFVRDTLAGTTERISVSSSNTEGNNSSDFPSISADGRYVAFLSKATNLADADTNGVPDVFVRDTLAGTTERISVSTSNAEGNNASYSPLSISSDGAFVAFASAASNLVSADTNAKTDIFVHNTLANTTTRVSLNTSLAQTDNDSYNPSIALDGSGGYYVVFNSDATNIASSDTNAVSDIFIHDQRFDADTTGPNVTIEQASGQADPSTQTSATAINFTAVFDEQIKPTTFVGADLTLGGTDGILSAVVSEIAPNNGTTFNIAVSGMSGNGNLTAELDATKVSDLAGNGNNASTSTDNSVTYVDQTPPSVSMSSTSASLINGMIEVTVTFNENVTGFAVGDITVANGTKSNFAGSDAVYTFDLTPSADGSVTANIAAGAAQDPAFNGNAAASQFSRTYDGTAPSTSINTQPSNPDDDTTPTFAFTGNDGAGSGVGSFMCKWDSGSYTACTSPVTLPTLADGSHTFYVYAIDNASNLGTPSSYTWTIDTNAPTVISIMRANPNTIGATSVVFTVTFSESVTGVDITDFSLTTTGVTGASITSITGSGATYTVSVNTGSGNGTIRLDVVDDDSIGDLIPHLLGGTGAGNGNFSGGEVYSIIKPVTLIIKSTGVQDGWILESTETSGKGGTLNANGTTFYLGDDAAKKQYRSILSFKTGVMPDNAIITAVTLKIKKQGVTGGGNPVTTFQEFMIDIRKGIFGTTTLQPSDFQTIADKSYGPFKPALVSNWYSINLTDAAIYINKLASSSGLTQIRLRFKLDDNNNMLANYLKVYSGNATVPNRPQLVITYYIP